MSYVCRIFTKDINTVQDVNYYSVNGKDFNFVADGLGKEYKLEDTEYVIVPTNVFKEMIDKVHANGKNIIEATDTPKTKKAFK